MGEILEKINEMEREDMALWLKKHELQYDTIEKDLMEFAHWLLEKE